jgi:hypothetical protein
VGLGIGEARRVRTSTRIDRRVVMDGRVLVHGVILAAARSEREREGAENRQLPHD